LILAGQVATVREDGLCDSVIRPLDSNVKSSSLLIAQPDDGKKFIVSAENLTTFLGLERQLSKSFQE
jgi:hypothetical protein